MNYVKPLIPFVLGVGLLCSTGDLTTMTVANGVLQLVLFAFVVCIPAWRTGRMSYVDIGWPFGLAVIGAVTLVLGTGSLIRILAISAVYLFIGLRMGLVAVQMWRRGDLKVELPRYQYQRLRWQRRDIKNVQAMMQVEVLVQGLANASFLALPAFLIASNSRPDIHPLEIAGLTIWLFAFAFESVADGQKRAFLMDMKAKNLKDKVCNVGLWRYSRHPNYFGEWMVWNGLILSAVPSWMDKLGQYGIIVFLLLGVALVFVSRIMYTTLVTYTGARPSEYYSAQKRPAYRLYQQTTNMFFPGFARFASNSAEALQDGPSEG